MKAERVNLEIQYLADLATNGGFKLEKEDQYAPTNVDLLVDSSKFTDGEYRCDCGAFQGQELIGQVCPRCKSEITLHSLDFNYTGWIDLKGHKVISPVYYIMLKRVLGTNVLRFILGDYKSKMDVKYNDKDPGRQEEVKQKRAGRVSQDDIRYIEKKVPKAKQIFKGIGHDEFYRRFEEVMEVCAPKNNDEVAILLSHKEDVFTSYIPIYSTAFRPVSKTSETKFYPKINKWFAMMISDAMSMDNMILDIELIQTLNKIQGYWMDAVEHIIKNEMSKKEGFVRSEIVGGSFSFSGRAVVTLDITLNVDEVDLPYSMVITAYQYRLTYMLATRYNMTLEQAYLFVNTYERNDIIISLLDEIIAEGQWVVYLREPTNNLKSIALSKIRRYKIGDDTMSIPLEVLGGMNADFDGDALDIWFLLDKGLIPKFEAFHRSCLTDRINETVPLDLKEWCAVSMGRMTE